MVWIHFVLAWLLVIGALLHGFGTVKYLDRMSEAYVWSFGSSLAALLVAAVNLLLINRLGDQTLALVSTVSSFAWAGVGIGFGLSIGNVKDPRVVWHAVCGIGLGVLSLLILI